MNDLNQRFNSVSGTPTSQRPQIDYFSGFGNQDLSNLINAAANALRNRGFPPPPPPAFSPPLHPATLHYVPGAHPHHTQVSPPSRPLIPPPPPRHSPTLIPSPPLPVPTKQFDMWENAKVEQIICAGLKPAYDGTPDNLIPTLNLINIRRRNEVWNSATYILQGSEQVDLVTQFSKVKEETIINQAKKLWDTVDASTQSHTRGATTYNSRLLGLFLMNSLTPEFAALLHSRIDSKYCIDGSLLLHTMCQHIHRNHLAFVESIKTKIRESTLVEFNNDVPKYLRFLTSNIKLITATGAEDADHNDLIPHLLQQLCSTNIPFQQTILQWQREYFENKLKLTPPLLLTKADQECQILMHTGQWVETIDPTITAMKATLQATNEKSGELLKLLWPMSHNSIIVNAKQLDRLVPLPDHHIGLPTLRLQNGCLNRLPTRTKLSITTANIGTTAPNVV